MKVVFFTIADSNNEPYAEGLVASLKKFHPDIPVVVYSGEKLKMHLYRDPKFFYRATPIVGAELIRDYDCIVKLDADQVVTGDLSHIWEGDFDVAVVNNTSPRDTKQITVNVWNINPLAYVNCGFVVMKSEKFIQHWYKLCHSEHFESYQYREQDLLNIMVHYGDWKVKLLDESSKWHGLITKGYWPMINLEGDKLVMPKNEEWPTDENKEVVCIHWGGGQVAGKMNFHLHFKPEVIERLKWLIKK